LPKLQHVTEKSATSATKHGKGLKFADFSSVFFRGNETGLSQASRGKSALKRVVARCSALQRVKKGGDIEPFLTDPPV